VNIKIRTAQSESRRGLFLVAFLYGGCLELVSQNVEMVRMVESYVVPSKRVSSLMIWGTLSAPHIKLTDTTTYLNKCCHGYLVFFFSHANWNPCTNVATSAMCL
jgi:hypothetical protein